MPPSDTPTDTKPEATGGRFLLAAVVWLVLSGISTLPAMLGGMVIAGPRGTDNRTAVALVLSIASFTALAGLASVGMALLAYATRVTPAANTRRHRTIGSASTVLFVLPLLSVVSGAFFAVLLWL